MQTVKYNTLLLPSLPLMIDSFANHHFPPNKHYWSCNIQHNSCSTHNAFQSDLSTVFAVSINKVMRTHHVYARGMYECIIVLLFGLWIVHEAALCRGSNSWSVHHYLSRDPHRLWINDNHRSSYRMMTSFRDYASGCDRWFITIQHSTLSTRDRLDRPRTICLVFFFSSFLGPLTKFPPIGMYARSGGIARQIRRESEFPSLIRPWAKHAKCSAIADLMSKLL